MSCSKSAHPILSYLTLFCPASPRFIPAVQSVLVSLRFVALPCLVSFYWGTSLAASCCPVGSHSVPAHSYLSRHLPSLIPILIISSRFPVQSRPVLSSSISFRIGHLRYFLSRSVPLHLFSSSLFLFRAVRSSPAQSLSIDSRPVLSGLGISYPISSDPVPICSA